MYFVFLLLNCLFCFCSTDAYRSPASYLDNRLEPSDKRYQTFLMALQLLEQRNASTIVETGTARCGANNFVGDGGSTVIFSDWASENKCHFYSVDISPEAIKNATDAIGTNPYAQLVCQNSITFLKDFPGTIDFLYLDSFDFDKKKPLPSQRHHLAEIEAAYPKLTSKSVVMIDDCALPYGGKGRLAIAYLLKRGWTMLLNQYQVILIKN